nr:hypothetical protein [Streptomyces sp. TLI_235]
MRNPLLSWQTSSQALVVISGGASGLACVGADRRQMVASTMTVRRAEGFHQRFGLMHVDFETQPVCGG